MGKINLQAYDLGFILGIGSYHASVKNYPLADDDWNNAFNQWPILASLIGAQVMDTTNPMNVPLLKQIGPYRDREQVMLAARNYLNQHLPANCQPFFSIGVGLGIAKGQMSPGPASAQPTVLHSPAGSIAYDTLVQVNGIFGSDYAFEVKYSGTQINDVIAAFLTNNADHVRTVLDQLIANMSLYISGYPDS